MPTADILTVADAIVAALNAATFSQEFTAERAYLPTYDLRDFSDLKVSVIPSRDDGRLDSRATTRHDYTIDVGIQKKPSAITNAELDPLMYLTQEIADFFLFGKRPGNATLITPQVRILYFQDHLQKLGQFTSVVSLTFRAFRKAS